MLIARVIKGESSLGIALPKEVVNRLRTGEGNAVYLTKTARGYEFSACDEEFASQVEVAAGIVRRYSGAFRKLAE